MGRHARIQRHSRRQLRQASARAGESEDVPNVRTAMADGRTVLRERRDAAAGALTVKRYSAVNNSSPESSLLQIERGTSISHLPTYLHFTRLRKDRIFRDIELKLAKIEGGKDRLYPVLPLRFWGHAHIFFPVFGLIFYYLIHSPGTNLEFRDTALTLLTVSIGSLSFAL